MKNVSMEFRGAISDTFLKLLKKLACAAAAAERNDIGLHLGSLTGSDEFPRPFRRTMLEFFVLLSERLMVSYLRVLV